VGLLRDRYEFAARLLRNLCGFTAQSRQVYCTIASQSLRVYCAIAINLLRNRFAIAADALQTRRYRFVDAPESLCNRFVAALIDHSLRTSPHINSFLAPFRPTLLSVPRLKSSPYLSLSFHTFSSPTDLPRLPPLLHGSLPTFPIQICGIRWNVLCYMLHSAKYSCAGFVS
jgi:hypothetical protein